MRNLHGSLSWYSVDLDPSTATSNSVVSSYSLERDFALWTTGALWFLLLCSVKLLETVDNFQRLCIAPTRLKSNEFPS